jgi:hypothetical protein
VFHVVVGSVALATFPISDLGSAGAALERQFDELIRGAPRIFAIFDCIPERSNPLLSSIASSQVTQ